MDPLPDSGVRQRGAELFLFPPPRIFSFILVPLLFHLNVVQNEKSNRFACFAGSSKPLFFVVVS